ncbi:MAG: hypothetical protein KDD82_13920 [Planctomycetes bacterium]|nr:hypothetical protein [Planctomycetota bacterium]
MSDDAPTLLGFLAEGLSPPLLGLCVLAGLGVGFLSAPSAPAATPSATPDAPPVDDDADPDGGDAGDDGDAGEDADGGDDADGPPLGAAELKRMIAAGEFAEAEREAERAGEVALQEEAHLLAALTARIQLGALASAKELEEIKVADQVHVGLVKQEDADLVQLVRYDGAPIDLPAKGLELRRTLHGMEARRVLAERLRADRDALGEVGGLTIHRYAFWAFKAGLRRLGTELLGEALRSEEGRVLVDMFGSGDFERLQRARLVVCGALPAPGTGIPKPQPQPVTPDPEPDADPRPEPDPGPVTSADPLAEDAAWLKAEAAYTAGVRYYRASYGEVGSPGLKRAIERFRAAQDLIDPLLDRYTGEPAQRIERRLVELNTLIYDCAKQGGTH